MTVISGVISWKRRRSCRGMLHDDDDDDDDDDYFFWRPLYIRLCQLIPVAVKLVK